MKRGGNTSRENPSQTCSQEFFRGGGVAAVEEGQGGDHITETPPLPGSELQEWPVSQPPHVEGLWRSRSHGGAWPVHPQLGCPPPWVQPPGVTLHLLMTEYPGERGCSGRAGSTASSPPPGLEVATGAARGAGRGGRRTRSPGPCS